MKPRTGQAGRIFAEAFHQIGRILLLLFTLAVLAIGLLGYRLSRGPIQIPALAGWLATEASGQGISIKMREADLAWAGYHQGGQVPLYLKLGGISVRNGAGAELAAIPNARLVVLPAALFGAAAPILVSATNARFNGSAVPVSLGAAISLGAGLKFSSAVMRVTLGPGRLGAGAQSVPIASGSFGLAIAQGAARLSDGALALARSGNSAPNVTFSGNGALAAQWSGTLHVTLDAVQAPDLPAYWPPATLPQTRAWVTKNITAGAASKAAFTFTLAAPKTLASLSVTDITGGFAGNNLTMNWIPHAQPITALNGQMVFHGLDTATVTADTARLGGMSLSAGVLTITGMNAPSQLGDLSLKATGAVPALLAVLNAPPLSLLAQAPPEIANATGNISGTITAKFPFLANLVFPEVTLNATAQLSALQAASPLAGLNFTLGEASLTATGQRLDMTARAKLGVEPAKLAFSLVYQGNLQHAVLRSAIGPALLARLGLAGQTALTDPVRGTAPFTLTLDGPGARTQSVTFQADLTQAALSAPSLGWAKPAGIPGQLKISGELNNGALARLDGISATAPGLAIASTAQGRVLRFSTLNIGATTASGELTAPPPGGAWSAVFTGDVLSVRAISSPPQPGSNLPPPSNAPPSGPAWAARLTFKTLQLAPPPAPALPGFFFAGSGQGSTLLQAYAAAAGITLAVSPLTLPRRHAVLQAPDAGLLLRALGAYNGLEAGTLALSQDYGGAAPADGIVTLTKFRIMNAPEFAKVLQGLTVYGVPEATSGPGLFFDHAVIPYMLGGGVLRLHGARAYSAALGFTASGTIATADGTADLDATIIPAYALNTLPSRIPLIGKLFSAEKGGGLIAVRAKITGRLSDPKFSVNPFSALTPGVLRDLFGLGGS